MAGRAECTPWGEDEDDPMVSWQGGGDENGREEQTSRQKIEENKLADEGDLEHRETQGQHMGLITKNKNGRL